MIKREIIWDNVAGDCMIWMQDNEDAEVTCISGDKVIYYKPDDMFTFHDDPDKLLHDALFMGVMNSMKISEKDRNNIRKYIKELWDEFEK